MFLLHNRNIVSTVNMGTKLELTLAKADGTSWPVLRSDDKLTGEVIQVGRAGRV